MWAATSFPYRKFVAALYETIWNAIISLMGSSLRHNGLFICFVVMFLLVESLAAQGLRGRVVDADNGQALAFVHVWLPENRQGTLTDIDGFFQLELESGQYKVRFSYMGYQTIEREFQVQGDQLHVRMYPLLRQLKEVVIVAGENPAHRIVRNAIENRLNNHPEQLESFSYMSYNKFVASPEAGFFDQLLETQPDTVLLRWRNFFHQHHLLVMESVTQRLYRAPGQSTEKVLGNRVSGFQNPYFALLATEMQSFSFYDNYITVLEKDFLSPLNRQAFNRYFYFIQDTLYQERDTVFVVGFRPVRGSNFDGLQGQLFIHSRSWALQNVIAAPAHEGQGNMHFTIQQMYEALDGYHWFPVQLHTDVSFFRSAAGAATNLPPFSLQSRSYFYDIQINPPLSRTDLRGYQVDFAARAHLLPDAYWWQWRRDTLSAKEERTYAFLDSLGKARNLDRMLERTEPLLFGEIRRGWFNFPLQSFYNYNEYERHRMGLGIRTNTAFSRVFELNGYGAWATGDQNWKYGLGAEVKWPGLHDFRIGYQHGFDVMERGRSLYLEKKFLLTASKLRQIYIRTMDYHQRHKAYLMFRALRHALHVELSLQDDKVTWQDLYFFAVQGQDLAYRQYRSTELGLRLRFAWGETFIHTPSRLIQMPSAYPVWYLNVTRGLPGVWKGEMDYLRIESALHYTYRIPLMGRQSWLLESGWTHRSDQPWPLLFTAKSGKRTGYLAAPSSFGTMDLDEFMADRYVALFFRHSFENLILRTAAYQPELVLIFNGGAGWASQPQNHIYSHFRSWEKGFFEAGFAVQRILPNRWMKNMVPGLSPGLEMLCRLGPYALPRKQDNITLKLALEFSL